MSPLAKYRCIDEPVAVAEVAVDGGAIDARATSHGFNRDVRYAARGGLLDRGVEDPALGAVKRAAGLTTGGGEAAYQDADDGAIGFGVVTRQMQHPNHTMLHMTPLSSSADLDRRRRHLVIGAGPAGITAARALAKAGVAYDHVEATDHIGGNWAHGTYDSTHMISSKRTSALPDYPMPRHYPDFPSREQVLAYIVDAADRFGLRNAIELETEVVECTARDERGMDGWDVRLRLPDGSEHRRRYAGVVVANGHHWDKQVPDYPGKFTGKTIHTRDYKNSGDLAGTRVLVVGAGNSGCDMAVESANTFGHADISMRRGLWFIPKTFLGIPLADYSRWWIPGAALSLAARAIVLASFGSIERYGLQKPAHGIFDADVTPHTTFIDALAHGRITPRKEISRFDGNDVHFVDGTSAVYDTIVWATGYRTSFPFLDDDLFTWTAKGHPEQVAWSLVPGQANLYLIGLIGPRFAPGWLVHRSAQLIALSASTQRHVPFPLVDAVQRVLPGASPFLVGADEFQRVTTTAEAAIRAVGIGARSVGILRQLLRPVEGIAEIVPFPRRHDRIAA